MFSGICPRLGGACSKVAGVAAKELGIMRLLAQADGRGCAMIATSAAQAADAPVQEPVSSSAFLTQQQQEAIQGAVSRASQQVQQALSLGTLTLLAGTYRDISISQEALYSQQINHEHPLQVSTVPPRPATSADHMHSSTTFPLLDVTELPDDDPSVPSGPQQYDKQYMDRITCWLQTQPNHVETSTMLQTGINLFPPQEATYPTYVDFHAATRLLEKHKSRKRLALLKRLRQYQDKYQLKTWDHRKGEL